MMPPAGDVSSVAEAGDVEESAALRGIFEAVMSCPAPVYTAMLSAMVTRLRALTSVDTTALSPVEDLMLRLNEQYPGDIGVFSPLFTNYVRLQPGQSFFIGANELHAYISGECVECMALSDNVVRAGLTPKLKDCETLCQMLTYKYVHSTDLTLSDRFLNVDRYFIFRSRLPSFLTPQPVDSCTSLYR
jgi:mannose-6-phosphate isomerase